MKRKHIFTVFIGLIWCQTSFADMIIVNVGPVSLGGGGPNPISIPPLSPVEYAATWLTDNDSEFRLSISPGLFYGVRSPGGEEGIYISAGGGLVLNGNGGGVGVYTAMGWTSTCKTVCFNAEYIAAIGLSGNNTVNPYAIRIGAGYKF